MDQMDELLNQFEHFKVSALKKLKKINSSNIGGVTIGPNRTPIKEQSPNHGAMKDSPRNSTKKPKLKITFELPVRQAIKEVENQRKKALDDAINGRIKKFQEFSSSLHKKTQEKWLESQSNLIENVVEKEKHILQELELYDKKTLDEQAKRQQELERERALQEELKEKELVRLATEKRKLQIESIKKAQIEYTEENKKISTLFKSSIAPERVKKAVGSIDSLRNWMLLNANFETFCKTGNFSDLEVQKAYNFVAKIKELSKQIEDDLENYKKNLQELEEAALVKPVEPPKPVIESPVQIVVPKVKPIYNLEQYASIENLKKYLASLEFLEEHTQKFKTLQEDRTLKDFKFDCKKAINIPVNAISAVNTSHLLDKYNRLKSLLSGKTVQIGNKTINASKHPEGIAFCMDLLAKKFVLQGDLMISSNPEAAFCYATIISSLWNDFPTLGKLLLAYFYKFCPYLVPYYVPKAVDETDEEFYIKQGYQYIDGQIEEQDKFLKRMTGITRLYAAILITKPQKTQKTLPHNLKNAWTWLVGLLKLKPRLDISATVLHSFLETIGFELDSKYGKAFRKLIRIIQEQYLPVCKKECTGGAATRLELLLNDFQKIGKFEKPLGYSSTPFW